MFSPSNEYSGLISFRNDSFDLLAVQGTLLHNSTVKGNWSQFNTPCMSYKGAAALTKFTSVGTGSGKKLKPGMTGT